DDTPFWRQVRDMDIPETLANRMAVFANQARLILDPGELFRDTSWVAVFMGQGLLPKGYDPQAAILPEAEVRDTLRRMQAVFRNGVATLPSQADFLRGRRTA
ncbi:MAG: tryptophan 7-halogenase, partial [Asticcacaulis sp.]